MLGRRPTDGSAWRDAPWTHVLRLDSAKASKAPASSDSNLSLSLFILFTIEELQWVRWVQRIMTPTLPSDSTCPRSHRASSIPNHHRSSNNNPTDPPPDPPPTPPAPLVAVTPPKGAVAAPPQASPRSMTSSTTKFKRSPSTIPNLNLPLTPPGFPENDTPMRYWYIYIRFSQYSSLFRVSAVPSLLWTKQLIIDLMIRFDLVIMQIRLA